MLSLGAKSIKLYLVLINLIFAVTGLVIILIGTGVKTHFEFVDNHVESKFFTPPTVLIVIGSIIFAISFLGCCGACFEKRGIILLFSLIIGAIFVAELAVGLAAISYGNNPQDLIDQGFNESLVHYNDTKENKDFWDTMQTKLMCCGVHNYTDWAQVMNSTQMLPNSCCAKTSNEPCTVKSQGLYKQGCLGVLGDELGEYAYYIQVAMLIISIIHVLSIVASCKLAGAIRAARYESV